MIGMEDDFYVRFCVGVNGLMAELRAINRREESECVLLHVVRCSRICI